MEKWRPLLESKRAIWGPSSIMSKLAMQGLTKHCFAARVGRWGDLVYGWESVDARIYGHNVP
ncbi:hypothetical protein M419DRAFT_121232 [Trichoderma reesei RUT C-30]|uniref:Uncharacterized protein n=1 Tax=Hypocrea jecorina (strain ATCC 56765 / BCRC 32924 / NRRL 11460 / Rut C-30) TaxID=1344414 RepID=A0A024RVY4_HYPJR|nr:hypothetical protein M419DRAFT_121232 [Trichoderma reesei RUT C-30]